MNEPSNLSKYSLHSQWKVYLTHGLLFFLTFLTTTLAGVWWLNKDPFDLVNFVLGLPYSLSLLTILAFHEFGHYFAARFYGVETSLPFFLPFPSFLGIIPFGTLGAVIIQRSTIPSRKALFDFAAAGPLAGFIISVACLVYGFSSLPPVDYLLAIHPNYFNGQPVPQGSLAFGSNLLYEAIAYMASSPGDFIPPMTEMYHYPFLCVGWFGLIVTAFNLLPLGQLDGGRISYAMFGDSYHRIAQVALIILIASGLLGMLPLIGIEFSYGWPGWLLWGCIFIGFIRFFGFNRKLVDDDTPLDSKRKAIGWVCWLIFLISLSPVPFTISP